jgi:hypothetical protein
MHWAGFESASDPEGSEEPVERAEAALEAAQEARGVGALWLAAGVLGAEANAGWAAEALERACRLDPLGPLAPFHLLVVKPGSAEAPELGARALLAEPRLAAATFWDAHPELLAAAVAQAQQWPGVEIGWRAAVAEAVAGLPAPGGPRTTLGWRVDEAFATSFSAHLFHRLPRPATLAPVEVWRWRAEAMSLPPAVSLPGTDPGSFAVSSCKGFDETVGDG